MPAQYSPFERVWGDGFADDTLSDLAAVDTWDRCGVDEAVRLFPRLIPADGRCPDAILAVLRARRAEIASRLQSSDAEAQALTCAAEGDRAASGAAGRHSHLSTVWRRARTRWSRLFGVAEDGTVARDRVALATVGRVLRDAGAGVLPPADAARMAMVAFHAGVHPAYLWPAAAIAHEQGSAAAWLGVVARGRPALMPLEVADYLADTLEYRDGAVVGTRDDALAPCLAGLDPKELSRVAQQRRRGFSAVMRERRAKPRRFGLAAPLRFLRVSETMR